MWRHVFTIELLKSRYDLRSTSDTQSFLDRIKEKVVRDPAKQRAVQYLADWSSQFWENAEYRIKEITQKVERDLKAAAKAKIHFAELGAEGALKLTEEEKTEVVQRGKNVINAIQMRELTDVLKFLNEDVFEDEKHKFYICIDRLDENWVDETFRYLLIRSLIETIRDFLQVRNVKIVAVLRTDLIERVFRETRDPGFQEEKYRSLYLQIRWDNEQLLDLLNRRVNFLVRQTYTKKSVGYSDVLPSKITKTSNTDKYLVERTMMRPRDLIDFFNSILEHAAGKASLTKDMVLEGEGLYSKNRMRSLQDEWQSDYPSLIECTSLLKQKAAAFRLSAFSREEIEDFCLNRLPYGKPITGASDLLSLQARAVAEGIVTWESFLYSTIHIFYITGLVGLKTDTYESYQWSNQGPSTIVADTIGSNTSVAIHPMFYRVLGIRPSTIS